MSFFIYVTDYMYIQIKYFKTKIISLSLQHENEKYEFSGEIMEMPITFHVKHVCIFICDQILHAH